MAARIRRRRRRSRRVGGRRWRRRLGSWRAAEVEEEAAIAAIAAITALGGRKRWRGGRRQRSRQSWHAMEAGCGGGGDRAHQGSTPRLYCILGIMVYIQMGGSDEIRSSSAFPGFHDIIQYVQRI
jgi:hypothetical protein